MINNLTLTGGKQSTCCNALLILESLIQIVFINLLNGHCHCKHKGAVNLEYQYEDNLTTTKPFRTKTIFFPSIFQMLCVIGIIKGVGGDFVYQPN